MGEGVTFKPGFHCNNEHKWKIPAKLWIIGLQRHGFAAFSEVIALNQKSVGCGLVHWVPLVAVKKDITHRRWALIVTEIFNINFLQRIYSLWPNSPQAEPGVIKDTFAPSKSKLSLLLSISYERHQANKCWYINCNIFQFRVC